MAGARGGARRLAGRARVRAAGAPGGALRRRRVRGLRPPQAMDRGGRIIAHGALRPGRDPCPARRARGHYPWIEPVGLEYFRNRLVQAPRDAQYALDLVVERCRTREQQEPPSRRCGSRRRCCGRSWMRSSAATPTPRRRRERAPACRPERVLRYDEVREEHVLLIPEGAVRLNETAAEVLELCDGERSLDEIAAALSERYDGADVTDDVLELLDGHGANGTGGRCRRLGPTPRRRALLPVPAALPVLLEPGRTSVASAAATSSRRSIGCALPRGARRWASLQLALTGGEPMVRRDLDELVRGRARGRAVLDARHGGHDADAPGRAAR